MLIQEIEPLLVSRGSVIIKIGDVPLTLDLRYPHERRYAACAVLNLQYPQRDIDTALLRCFIRSGDHVLDLGANIGLTALECLQAGAAHVCCVEAVSELAVRIPDDPRLTIVQAAAGEVSGETEIVLSVSHNQGSTISALVQDMFPTLFVDAPRRRIPVVAVDDLGQFDVWKIDVEGSENQVLVGGSGSLSTSPPRVIIAEIFDPFIVDIRNTLQTGYDTHLRAGLTLDDYRLETVDPTEFDPGRYHSTSPMYVFTNCKDILSAANA